MEKPGNNVYNPNVRVGNWNEEICFEEDILKDFLEKQESGCLLIQRTQALMNTFLEKVDLGKKGHSSDSIFYGSNVILANPGREGLLNEGNNQNLPRKLLAGRNCSSLSINLDEWPVGGNDAISEQDIPLTAGHINLEEISGCVRNSFKIVKPDGSVCDEVLRYGEKFALQAFCGSEPMYVFTDRLRLGSQVLSNRKIQGSTSPLQLIASENGKIPFGCLFVVESFDPLLRLEHISLPVPTNEIVLIKHCGTGQHLAVLDNAETRTPFGKEMSVGAQTFFNSHKAETDNNYWILKN